MKQTELKETLSRLEGQNYKAYRQVKGQHSFSNWHLIIDHVQGDPFATPSQLRLRIKVKNTHLPDAAFESPSRKIALRDFLTRRFQRLAKHVSRPLGTGRGGMIEIANPGQQILDRSSCLIDSEWLEFRFRVGLPARGRRIMGHAASKLLTEVLPELSGMLIDFHQAECESLLEHVTGCEDADHMRDQLGQHQLIAFVANGSRLPRESGFSDRPLSTEVVPFQAPPELEVTLQRRNRPPISGMGVPHGVNLIVGGGFHGKSTLLRAIERGIYNHIPGDGREWIVTNPHSARIRAEDGRSIHRVNISGFIDHLPLAKSTKSFSTPNASGSTSQATNIVEAMELGCEVLLIDEDTSATNFLVRDQRMQRLIPKDKEPITPLLDRIRELYQEHGLSCIMVMGGCGDYFEVADRVIALDHYRTSEVTMRARTIAEELGTDRKRELERLFPKPPARYPKWRDLNPARGRKEYAIKINQVSNLQYGSYTIDVSRWEALVDSDQLRAIGLAMAFLFNRLDDQRVSLSEACDQVKNILMEHSFNGINMLPDGDLAQFRTLDLAAVINRMPELNLK